MAQQPNPMQDLEAAGERLREFNEQIFEATRKAGEPYLELYEGMLRNLAELSTQLGGQGQPVEWFTTLVNAQADFARQMARSYETMARDALR